MTKNMHANKIATREKITQKALELFNRNGIEYVGMRELAASMNMKIGNITYYFPTKDELVNALALELSALNQKAFIAQDEKLTLSSFLETTEMAFRNQWQYRCLLLSFVHIIRQNPMIRKRYKDVEDQRKRQMTSAIASLESNGYLKSGTTGDIQSLSRMIGLFARFWLSDATIVDNGLSEEGKIRYYIGLIAFLLRKYATAKGEKEITRYLGSS